MAANLISLTPEDLTILKGLVYREKTRPKNTTGRGAVPGYADAEPTTEVYIAKVHPAGIPALTETTNNANDIPGSKVCDIYRIIIESGVPRLRAVGISRTVYNLSLQDIDEDEVPWISIKREKFGSWLADSASVEQVGTGSDTTPYCGLLILDCPEDGPGTGSEVYVPGTGTPDTGIISLCNDGEIVLTTIHLSVAYGSDAVSVPLVTTDGHVWRYSGPTVDVGTCGAGLQVVEVALTCEPPWRLELVLNLPTLQAFGNPADFPNWTMVSASPMYWTTETYAPVSTGCGFEVIELALTE